MHLNTHNGDNLYQCSSCDIAFTQNFYLGSNIRIQTRKKYQCSYCEKSFWVEKSHAESYKKSYWRETLSMQLL